MNRAISNVPAPDTVAAVVDRLRSGARLLPVGAGTKPRLARADAGWVAVSMRGIRGVVEYEPEEFIVTARAGTPMRELASLLEERGQYLPFDPVLLDAGSTLGGTLASGLNGPGRFRYGGIRDFVLGVRFIDGLGRHLRMGGKVVKNAAGFDVSKFLVGSLGRFGTITEATLKVFPRRPASATVRLEAAGIGEAVRIVGEAAAARWEADALEIGPGDTAVRLRLTGPDAALPVLVRDVLSRWKGAELAAEEASGYWAGLREFAWAHEGGILAKVPVTPDRAEAVAARVSGVDGARVHFGNAGNVAWVSIPAGGEPGYRALSEALRQTGLTGLTLRGGAETPLWIGAARRAAVHEAVKSALDPEGRFPDLMEAGSAGGS